MTGSLRLSALLFLLLSRWASADLEKGEDEFVRSWVIIEEQLVPPSRDELLQIGSVGGGGAVGGATSRRITPKSVFVAPSFNKCSDGYRPDSMGRCVKVVKINQAAQWDFLLKQLNSMYGSGSAGFPVQSGQSAYRPAVTMTTTTAESPLQKTDSPGPFQLNIPLVMDTASPVNNQTATTIDDDEITTGFTSTTTGTITTTNTGTTTTTTTTTNNKTPKNTTTASTIVTTTADAEVTDDDDDARTTVRDIINTTTTSDVDDVAVTVTDITTDPSVLITSRPRPYRNRYHQTEQQTAAHTTTSDPPTTTATDAKIKYVESSSRATNVETDDSSQTIKTTTTINTPSSSTPSAVTTTTVGVTEADDLATISTMTTTEADDDEDVVTVLAVAAVDGDRPSLTRFPVSDMKTQLPQVVDTVTPEYYDDQPEVPISVSEPPSPDCSSQDAYLYYVECMDFRQQQLQQQQQQQQQQFQQLHQQQLLIQQQQQQQHHQQLYQQQQHQQQQQQLYNQQQFQLAPHNHVAGALVKRPAAIGGGVQIRFPEEGSGSVTVADHANLIRFPGPAPYRTTNKMYESSRHPTWWPTGWPEQQPQPGNGVQQQQQQQQQYHLQQNHPSQQKQDARYWEFGSRLPKSTTTSTTTTVVPPPPPPPPPSQWFRRYF